MPSIIEGMSHKKPLFLYLSSEILLSLGIGIVLYAQPFYYQHLGLTDQTIGLLFAVNSAAAGMTALLLGSAADRIGASHVFKLATLILPLGYACTSLSHTFWPLVLATALSGCGAALLMSTENVVLSSLLEGVERSHVLSRFVSMYTLVMAVGTALSGVISRAVGYDHTLMVGAACALLAPLIRVFVRARDARSAQLFRRPTKDIVRMGLYAILFGCASGVFTPFVTLILQGHYGVGDRAAASVSALALLFTSIGAFCVTPFVRKIGRRQTTTLSFWLGIVVSLALAWRFPDSLPFIVLFLARTAIFSVPGSIVDATFLEWTEPTMHVQMFGVRVFGTSIGSAIGSYAGGTLLNFGLVGMMLSASAAVFAIALIYLRYLWRKQSSAGESGKDFS